MGPATCVFSTCNDSYVPKAAVALLSFREHNPHCDMFIICTAIGDANRGLCEALGIEVVLVDLGRQFHTEWQYPRECYYHFWGPSYFWSRGYAYSVYVDGDTYCHGPFPIPTSSTFDVAGCSFDTVRGLFETIGELAAVEAAFPDGFDGGADRARLQTGVLLYANQPLSEGGFFDRAVELYERSISLGVPRKGDDSLLALLLALHLDLRSSVLPDAFNIIDFQVREVSGGRIDDSVIAACGIYHFVEQKPWDIWDWYPDYVQKYFTSRWQEMMINCFPDDQVLRCFPALYNSEVLPAEDVGFYWFIPQTNFGDWVTPYLYERICGRAPEAPVDPVETGASAVLSTGSIMRLCGPNTVVWGSGIRHRDQDILPGKEVRSVRGPLTRARLLEVGGECPPIYGDPALLLPWFYQPAEPPQRFRLGIAPHISQYERVRDLYADEPDVLVLDLRTKDVEAVIDALCSCEAVVASSLHGIVVANAYGIPVRWVKFDTNIFGDDTKYYDHFLSIGRPEEGFIDALGYRKVPVVELLRAIEPYEPSIDRWRLWDSSVFRGGDVSKYVRYLLS